MNRNNNVCVALVGVVVSILLVSLSFPILWLSRDGHRYQHHKPSRSDGAAAAAAATSSSSWEVRTLHLARQYQKRVVMKLSNDDDDDGTDDDNDKTDSKNHDDGLPLQNVVILITGATSGIGKGLALWTLKQGATVIAMGRSQRKLQQLQQEAEAAMAAAATATDFTSTFRNQQHKDNNNTILSNRLFLVVADFADLQSVSDAVDSMQALSVKGEATFNFPNHIDILVCNAGIHLGLSTLWHPNPVTVQGYDLTFGVNYLSHFLLVEKLWQHTTLLQTSNYPRIVHVTSSFHFAVDGSDLKLDSSNDECNNNNKENDDTTAAADVGSNITASIPGGNHGFYFFRSQRQYANSKLAQILHARYWQRKLRRQQQQVKQQQVQSSSNSNNMVVVVPHVVTACPAWVGTSILRAQDDDNNNDSWIVRFFRFLAFDMNGYGLSSILTAMFVEIHNDDDADDTNGKNDYHEDYFVSTSLMHGGAFVDNFLMGGVITNHNNNSITTMENDKSVSSNKNNYGMIPSWTYRWLPIRDVLLLGGAMVILFWQRWFVNNVDTATSSCASYDESLQEDLYRWSYHAVQEYLRKQQ